MRFWHLCSRAKDLNKYKTTEGRDSDLYFHISSARWAWDIRDPWGIIVLILMMAEFPKAKVNTFQSKYMSLSSSLVGGTKQMRTVCQHPLTEENS